MENTKKMEYIEFKEALKNLVQEKSDSDMKVEIVQIIKNNQTKSENLTYIDPNYNLFPSIQLKELYQEYQVYGMGWCVEEAFSVLKNVKRIHEDQLMGSWESAKGRIVVELVKEAWNRELLEKLPYRAFLDLAVIYRLKMWECKSGDAVQTVTNKMMEHWKITEEELYEAALANLQKEEFEIIGGYQAVQDMIEELIDVKEESEFHEWMYIFTNRSRIKGAAAMLRTDLLDRFAKAQESDLIILPSSVHEVILLPTMDDEDAAELRRIVQDINEKEVQEEERLSDEVYYFRRSTGAVELIPE
ncbi:hypothetical protein EBB54_13385 [Schaedlerella arabinosiphila]|uniref:Uncharacterized protein n=1 Tax=Schaedlerella arabinosiphila TaxID=2044587 RepID=A0A426DHJ7_9FIRM|nr:DUF5688 family protein [Schaedlerella arabinosiphila]RRK32245.1 hypothetical protein EBB54_13385 [Schaedlerella arabinosiphila]